MLLQLPGGRPGMGEGRLVAERLAAFLGPDILRSSLGDLRVRLLRQLRVAGWLGLGRPPAAPKLSGFLLILASCALEGLRLGARTQCLSGALYCSQEAPRTCSWAQEPLQEARPVGAGGTLMDSIVYLVQRPQLVLQVCGDLCPGTT